jgi:sodium/pantothenate symporter
MPGRPPQVGTMCFSGAAYVDTARPAAQEERRPATSIMNTLWLAWAAVLGYFAVTGMLAWRGRRHMRSLADFAVGARNIPAVVAGCAIAAQLTSVATFLINPGLVYAYGLAALLGYGVSGGLGCATGFALFARRFRRHGAMVAALSVPHWIGTRYQSDRLRALFALLSLALVTKATLIVVALALLLSDLLMLPPQYLSVALAVWVVASVMVGGATGHAWANAAHAVAMIVVALIMIAAGLPLLLDTPGVVDRLAAIDPDLARPVNPQSLYFRSTFEVFVCNFIIGIAVVTHPHVLSKAFYLRDDDEVRTFLAIAIGAVVIFTAVLVTGLWARLVLPSGLEIDRVIPAWMNATFAAPMRVLIAVGLLSAGLSTLEGILLALSTTISADLYPLVAREFRETHARRIGQLGLAATGATTAVLAIWQIDHPTGRTVTIFSQYGTYMLLSAAVPPLVCGMFLPQVGLRSVGTGVAVALLVYFGMTSLRITSFHNNPAVVATAAMGAAALAILLRQMCDRGEVPARTRGGSPEGTVPQANR